MADSLTAVAARLEGLSELPVTAHPDVLDAVHRALVSELDLLRVHEEVPLHADPEHLRRSA